MMSRLPSNLERSRGGRNLPAAAVARRCRLRRLLAWSCLALGVASSLPVAAQAPPHATQPQSVELLPSGVPEGGKNPVALRFNGHLYGEGSWLSERHAAGVQPTAVEKFLSEALETYREGDLADVLELWLPEDRAKLQELFENAEIFEQNRSFYRRLTDSAFVAKVLYGPSYVLLFVQHSGRGFEDFVKVYPLLEQGGSYYLTNRLQADPVFVYFSTVYKDALPLREKPKGRDENGGTQNAPAGS